MAAATISCCGRYDHPDEESDNVFRVFALTKHYTKKDLCGLQGRLHKGTGKA